MNYESRVMAGRREKAKDLTVCGLFSALIAVGAFIKIVIPVGADSMNFTLQWFFVLLAGLLLGSKRAFLSVSTYLLIGLMAVSYTHLDVYKRQALLLKVLLQLCTKSNRRPAR